MIALGVFFPPHLITRQAIRDLNASKDDFDKSVSQNEEDIKNAEKELEAWKTITDDAITRRILPIRAFREEFEASVMREWEVVRTKLEQSLLGPSSQGGLVSTQVPDQLCFNPRFRERSPAGQSIETMFISISTNWHDLLLPFKRTMLTKFSKLVLKVFKMSSNPSTISPIKRLPILPGRKSSRLPWKNVVTSQMCLSTG